MKKLTYQPNFSFSTPFYHVSFSFLSPPSLYLLLFFYFLFYSICSNVYSTSVVWGERATMPRMHTVSVMGVHLPLPWFPISPYPTQYHPKFSCQLVPQPSRRSTSSTFPLPWRPFFSYHSLLIASFQHVASQGGLSSNCRFVTPLGTKFELHKWRWVLHIDLKILILPSSVGCLPAPPYAPESFLYTDPKLRIVSAHII